MPLAVWTARLILAGVFAVAAAVKARDPAGTRASADALGVPSSATRSVAVALPVLEAVAAVLLLVPATSVGGAALAAVLLIAFSVAVLRTLRTGRRPACHCFGARSTAPIGSDTIVRNAALLALSLVVIARSA